MKGASNRYGRSASKGRGEVAGVYCWPPQHPNTPDDSPDALDRRGQYGSGELHSGALESYPGSGIRFCVMRTVVEE